MARGIAALVNRPEDDHYEVLAVVLNALHLLLDVPCVELWDILYFVLEEDVALLLRYSKRILCDMRLELPQVTIAVRRPSSRKAMSWIGNTGMARCDALSGSSRSSVFQPFCDTYKENSRSIMSDGERFTTMHIQTFLPPE